MPAILVKRPIHWMLLNGYETDIAVSFYTTYRGPILHFLCDNPIGSAKFEPLKERYPDLPSKHAQRRDRFKIGFFAKANLDRSIDPQDVGAEHRSLSEYKEGRHVLQLSKFKAISPIPYYPEQVGRGKRELMPTPPLSQIQSQSFQAEANRVAEATCRLYESLAGAGIGYKALARNLVLPVEQVEKWTLCFGKDGDRPYVDRIAAFLQVDPDWLWGAPLERVSAHLPTG